MPRSFLDRSGRQVGLAREIARGGEGIVYEVVGDSALVAKVYHTPPETNKSGKLAALVGAKNDELLKLTAWPVDTLHAKFGGPAQGFLMPRIDGHVDIHKLYGPKSRMQEFPGASWKFLVHAAANMARAFAVVHKHGHVVGDVNHGSVLVARNALVRLVDVDSFQITSAGRTYTCDVGVLTHQPPEFQGKTTFRGLLRTSNHDNFGLAVLIFQLLFMARHPFSGRYGGPDEMPIERAIREFRYAYGTSARSKRMEPPPGVLPVVAVSGQIAQLFERAFGEVGARGNRPTAVNWTDALTRLETDLKQCAINASHHYLSSLSACPICAIERSASIVLFLPPAGMPIYGGTFNLAVVWRGIEGVASPGPAPDIPRPTNLSLSPQVARMRSERRLRKVLAIIGVVVAVALWSAHIVKPPAAGWLFLGSLVLAGVLFSGASKKKGSNVSVELTRARSNYDAQLRQWKQDAGDAAFAAKLAELLTSKRDYEGLPNLRLARLRDLEARKRESQLHAFLDRFEIEDARIKGVGPALKSTLESNGIETAADISYDKVLAVPGFGPTKTKALVDWRRTCEQKFRFDPSKEVDRTAIAAVERDILSTRMKLEGILTNGAAELTRVRLTTLARRDAMRPRVAEALRALAQAQFDSDAA